MICVIGYICKGVLDTMGIAEAAPQVKDLGASGGGGFDVALPGEVQCSAESMLEMLLALGCSSHPGSVLQIMLVEMPEECGVR